MKIVSTGMFARMKSSLYILSLIMRTVSMTIIIIIRVSLATGSTRVDVFLSSFLYRVVVDQVCLWNMHKEDTTLICFVYVYVQSSKQRHEPLPSINLSIQKKW